MRAGKRKVLDWRQERTNDGRQAGASGASADDGASADEAALSTVETLMAERRKYESWLETLEARRQSTPEHVFTRVHADYHDRLDAVIQQLKEHTEGLRAELASLTSRLVVARQRAAAAARRARRGRAARARRRAVARRVEGDRERVGQGDRRADRRGTVSWSASVCARASCSTRPSVRRRRAMRCRVIAPPKQPVAAAPRQAARQRRSAERAARGVRSRRRAARPSSRRSSCRRR